MRFRSSATYRRLSDRMRGHQNVVAVRAALSDRTGGAELNVFGEGLGINSLHGSAAWEEARRAGVAGEVVREQVPLTTADAFCAERGVSVVALLKIDAEGHDLTVMEGARGLLTDRRVQVVQFEYNQRWIEARHFLKDAFELLQPLGYQLGKVTALGLELYPHWHFELETFREGNYLACLPEQVAWFPQIRWWNL